MSEGPGLETYADRASPLLAEPAAEQAMPSTREVMLRRTLLFFGIAAISAGCAFLFVRVTLLRPPADPTTERIQQLIDEANRLLAQLDDKKPDS
ncbi:MAG: hypothetical protein GIX03_03380 [Candidatus Eremiobacteraeota bacterium]|nr:hypothetical protein [Candidatus Eremiobacteraeota bacterium]MBC5802056.1 hypothetical protein [Candidatus Eremiobacteraeota bacterium]MBC5822707.1 hypothetical protein [Candidatus Eremiobacteraeota bacterium]